MAANNWSEWQNHVLNELSRMSTKIESIEDSRLCDHDDLREKIVEVKDELKSDIADVKKEIEVIKVKTTIRGLIAGAIPTSVIVVLYLLQLWLKVGS